MSKSPDIKIKRVGTLHTEKVGKDGFLAVFTTIKPASKSCSGTCDSRGSVSWTCEDYQSCYLRCDTTPIRGDCE